VIVVDHEPRVIGPSKQMIEVTCRGKLTPIKVTRCRLQLQILTPATIAIPNDTSVEIQTKGPPALQLAIAQNGRVSTQLRATPSSDHNRVILDVEPRLLDGTNVVPATIAAEVQVGSPFELSSPIAVQFGRRQRIAFDLPPSAQAFSLFDRIITANVVLGTKEPSPAIIGTMQRLELVIESPIKSLLPMASGVFFLAVVGLGTICFDRLNQSARTANPRFGRLDVTQTPIGVT
jgi:hypothetical protein